MPPHTALPLGLCGHASSACMTFLLPPGPAALSRLLPLSSPLSFWSPQFVLCKLCSVRWAFLAGELHCGHQKELWACWTVRPSSEPAWRACGEERVRGPRGHAGAPCAPHCLALQPLHLFLHHSVLMSRHCVPGTVLSALDTKTNTPSCQAANRSSSPLPFPPHRTRHTFCTPVTGVACRTRHLLGFAHLCAFQLCNFWSSPRICLSLSLTSADTYLACKTPFCHCLNREAFCNAPRLGEMPPAAPVLPLSLVYCSPLSACPSPPHTP